MIYSSNVLNAPTRPIAGSCLNIDVKSEDKQQMITSLEGLCRNSMWLGDPDLINLVKSRNFEYFKDRIQIPELSTKGGDTRITITMNRFVRNKVGIGWFSAV